MTRRGTFIATTVTAALLAALSLGAREDEWREPSPETCKTNLEAVFDWCGDKEHACKYVDEEELDACEAGCVMLLCPAQITCTELDPTWCGMSCADPQGARFWSHLHGAARDCDYIVADDEDNELEEAQWRPWLDCQLAYRKQQCPELTDWLSRRPSPDDPAE